MTFRSAMKAVIDRLTYSAFSTTARGILERDRQVYALLLAIEVHSGQSRLNIQHSSDYGELKIWKLLMSFKINLEIKTNHEHL